MSIIRGRERVNSLNTTSQVTTWFQGALATVYALAFTGSAVTDQHVNKTSPTSFPTGAGAWTMAVHFKPTERDSGDLIMHMGNDASVQDVHFIFRASNILYLDRFGSSSEVSCGVPDLNAWNSVCATYDGTSVRTWLNGSAVTGATAKAINLVQTRTQTGGWSTQNIFFAGTIKHAEIWAERISDAEAVAITADPTASTWTQPVASPVLWWNFNEGSGTTAPDVSGTGNDGTLVNGPTWVEYS